MDQPHPNGVSPVPDIPYLRPAEGLSLMADALDAGQPVCIFPPGAADTLREEPQIEPAEFAQYGGFIEAAPDDEEEEPPVLLIHIGHDEHLASGLITGSLTLAGREEDRS